VKNTLSNCNNGCSGKAISITISESVFVALGIQRANACALLPSLALPPVQKLYTLHHRPHDFRIKLFKKNMCFYFSTTFVWDIYNSKKNWEKYDKKCTLVSMQILHYSCPILMRLEFSRNIFDKYSKMKRHENPCSVSRFVPCGMADWRTDRHDEAKSRFSQFYERA